VCGLIIPASGVQFPLGPHSPNPAQSRVCVFKNKNPDEFGIFATVPTGS